MCHLTSSISKRSRIMFTFDIAVLFYVTKHLEICWQMYIGNVDVIPVDMQ